MELEKVQRRACNPQRWVFNLMISQLWQIQFSFFQFRSVNYRGQPLQTRRKIASYLHYIHYTKCMFYHQLSFTIPLQLQLATIYVYILTTAIRSPKLYHPLHYTHLTLFTQLHIVYIPRYSYIASYINFGAIGHTYSYSYIGIEK